MTHCRWICPASPYNSQYVMSTNASGYIVSVDPTYWTNRMAYLQNGGVVTYEQDWLSSATMPAMNLNDPPAFMNDMAAAASTNGMNMQYCLPAPCDYLQGSLYNNLMTIRTSEDGFTGAFWDQFIYDSRLAGALGEWPWTDVYPSSQTRDLLIGALSAGPVGVGDALGTQNFANLLKAVRQDSVIVKPDAPLLPLDQTYLNDVQNLNLPMVASTYTDHNGPRDDYVFAYARTSEIQMPALHLRNWEFPATPMCMTISTAPASWSRPATSFILRRRLRTTSRAAPTSLSFPLEHQASDLSGT